MNRKEALKKYREQQKKQNAYNLLMQTTYFDNQTIAPEKGSGYRNEMMSYMAGECYLLETDKEFIECVKYLQTLDLDSETKREINLAYRSLENIIKFSKEEIITFEKECMESFDAWKQAKRKDDYSLWSKHLVKLIELSKQKATKRNDKKDPYDVYLDDYEESMNQKQYDKFFSLIKKELLPLIKKINDKTNYIDTSFLYKYYPKEKQEKFIKEYVLKYIGFDESWGYMGTSEHPFTSGFSKNDVRITTHYKEYDISSAIFSVVHEVGHATYEHQVNAKYEGTLIGKCISSGMHESQSRFFENYLARRKSFWTTLYPKLVEIFPENLTGVSLEEFVRAINASRCSYIRTDADELTYPIHILIRYEIEKAIFAGEVDLENLDKIWNQKYKEYLGLDVSKDSEGILQDIHWSDASFGYFPTYALGSAIGAQILNQMEKDIDVDKLLEKAKFSTISKYLKSNIQHYGALYNYNEILQLATGESFNPKYYINYLKKKYKKLYEIR